MSLGQHVNVPIYIQYSFSATGQAQAAVALASGRKTEIFQKTNPKNKVIFLTKNELWRRVFIYIHIFVYSIFPEDN